MVRHVTLVYGPPCGGKTTYVTQHAQKSDKVLDLDAIAQECGSPRKWHHDTQIIAIAEQVMRSRMQAIRDTPDVTAWIIRTAPTRAARDAASALCGATNTVAIIPTMGECLARARRDKRPQGTEQTIRRWFAMHQA